MIKEWGTQVEREARESMERDWWIRMETVPRPCHTESAKGIHYKGQEVGAMIRFRKHFFSIVRNKSHPVIYRKLSSILCGDLDERDAWKVRREPQEGGDICTHLTDSLRRTAETNKTLQNSDIPAKLKKERKKEKLS